MTETLIWVAVTMLALLKVNVSLVLLGGALADLEYLRVKAFTGGRIIVAVGNVRTHGLRALAATVALADAIITLSDAQLLGDVTRHAYMIALVLAILAGDGLCAWWDRRRLFAELLATEPKGHQP